MKNWKPFHITYSKVPAFLSWFAPIEIAAICFGPFVFSRRILTPAQWRHECIHFRQQLELLFLPMWVLYSLFWLIGLIRWRDRVLAYRRNPFEREAFAHEVTENYLQERGFLSWWVFFKMWLK